MKCGCGVADMAIALVARMDCCRTIALLKLLASDRSFLTLVNDAEDVAARWSFCLKTRLQRRPCAAPANPCARKHLRCSLLLHGVQFREELAQSSLHALQDGSLTGCMTKFARLTSVFKNSYFTEPFCPSYGHRFHLQSVCTTTLVGSFVHS